MVDLLQQVHLKGIRRWKSLFRLLKIVLWMMVCLIIVMSLPITTSAHAYIVKSSPSENEILDTTLKTISIQFNEDIQPTFYELEVTNDVGKHIDLDGVQVDDKTLKADFKSDLLDGVYTIKWKVISSDGHPIEGTIPFAIGENTAGLDTLTSSNQSYSPKGDMITIRTLLYLGYTLLLGNLFFKLFVYPKDRDHFTTQSWIVHWAGFIFLTLAILLSLPLQVTIEAGVPWSNAFNSELLREVIVNTSFGQIWMFEVVLLLFLLVTSMLITLQEAPKLWLIVSFIIGVVLILSKAFIGHAAAEPNKGLAVFMDFLHMLASSIWLGSLLIIAFILPIDYFLNKKEEKKEIYWSVIQKFSRWGIAFVIILSLSGIYSSFLHVPTVDSLFSTLYGKVLVGKIVLLLVMILFATYNFFSGRKKNQKLRITVWSEFAVGVVVLVLAAMLTNLPTASASPGIYDKTQEVQNQYLLTLQISPNVLGMNEIKLNVTNKDGDPVENIEQITAKLIMLEMDMGENVIQLQEVAPGTYRKETMLSMAGKWDVYVHILTKSLESIDTDFKVLVGSQ